MTTVITQIIADQFEVENYALEIIKMWLKAPSTQEETNAGIIRMCIAERKFSTKLSVGIPQFTLKLSTTLVVHFQWWERILCQNFAASFHLCLYYEIASNGNLIMMTSSNGDIFPVTGSLCGEFIGHLSRRPLKWSFDVIFDLHLDKWLSK